MSGTCQVLEGQAWSHALTKSGESNLAARSNGHAFEWGSVTSQNCKLESQNHRRKQSLGTERWLLASAGIEEDGPTHPGSESQGSLASGLLVSPGSCKEISQEAPGGLTSPQTALHGILESERGLQPILEAEGVDNRTIPVLWDWELGSGLLHRHLLYSSRTWRLSRQWMRKMKAPCRLLTTVNRYAMTLATGPIWKIPSTQVQPKMKSWAKALNVSNLVSLSVETSALTLESFCRRTHSVHVSSTELILMITHTGPRKLQTNPVSVFSQQRLCIP